MKINPIQSVSFGYNKTLNAKLEKTLQENPSAMTNTLLAMNHFCNSHEDFVRRMEKEHKPVTDQNDIIDNILPIKSQLGIVVDIIFPHLKYREKESQHYFEDPSAPKKVGINQNWRSKMGAELEMDTETKYQTMIAQREDKIIELVDVVNNQSNFIRTQQANQINPQASAQQAAADPSIIEQFAPNEDSPDGFESIGGMGELKKELEEKIINPLLDPQGAQLDYKEYGIKYPRGILLYGPPGCGKTFITEALAMESGLPLFKLKISQVGSKFINQTSKNIEAAFQTVENKVKETGYPCLMLIDEIDGVTKDRDGSSSPEDLKQMQTLLQLIETARGRGIVVIGATNKYDLMDFAIKRRFDGQVYVGMPDLETRKQILIKNLENMSKSANLINNDEKLTEIAKKLGEFPNSAICIISDKAARYARNSGRESIDINHYLKAIEENQNLKIKEDSYKLKSANLIGFNRSQNHPTN